MKSLLPKPATSEDGRNLLTKSSLLPACKHTWKHKHAKNLLNCYTLFSENHAKLYSCSYSNYVFLHLEGTWTRSILMLRKLLLIATLRYSLPLNSYLLIISYLSFIISPSIYLCNLIKFLLNLKDPLYCSPLFKLSVLLICTYILVLGEE